MKPLLAAALVLLSVGSAYAFDGERTIRELVDDLGHPDREVRREAAYLLDRMGAEASEAVPALVRALGDEDRQVWYHAVQALARVGPAAKEAVPALIRDLEYSSSQVWYRSAYALGCIGSAAVPALLGAGRSCAGPALRRPER